MWSVRPLRSRRPVTRPAAVLAAVLAAGLSTGLLLTAPASPARASAPTATQVEPASISGYVYSQMDPVDGVRVAVFDAGTGRLLASVAADWGRYEITGLPPVAIKIVGFKPGYWPSWASFKDDWRHADVIQLHPGEHLVQTGENWWPLYMDVMPFSSIAGTVRGAGKPLAHAVVTVYDAATGRPVAATVADGRGRWTINPLRMKSYKVSASKPGWRTGYANDRASLAEGDARLVLPGDHWDGDQLDWPHLDLDRAS